MAMSHGFELVREQYINELNTKARIYRHVKTGAQLVSMENNDENKVFGITFFTPPPDSTGLTHILEHSVLCGSKNYPVKEPFVELIKASLNTFVNAMTFPDKTTYPVASTNVQDLYNLIDVYLDAVFYPRITPEILQQEGWHYELEDANEPMVYKGVVFNEMKGAYSSPDNVFGRYIQQSLFPDNIYGLESGGDPTKIPDLTYETFKCFHETYYHPSNALIWFYGDDDPEVRLSKLDAVLSGFEKIDIPNREIAPQPRFSEPRREQFAYDAGSEEGDIAKRTMATVNWLMPDVHDPELTLSLEMLSYILVGTAASPLRKALIDSGIGEDITGGGLESEVNPMYFSAGLKGIAVEDVDKVQALILDTLQSLVKDGIDPEMIEAAMNTFEFRLREQNTGNFPRGLALMLESLTTWLHGGDPLAPLAFEAPLNALKQKVAAGRYFEGLIEQLMLNNTHRTTVILAPDPELNARLEAQERARLDNVRAAMTETDINQVIENTRRLKLMQETPDSPEALATIPVLKLEDLDKKNKILPIEVTQESGTKVLYHDLFTNGVVYLDLGLNLHTLPQNLLPYMGIFGRALLSMGTTTQSYVKLSQRIGRKTGGITASTYSSMVKDQNASTIWMFLRAKSTPAQADDMLAILRDILLTADIDNKDRFRQIALEEKARREAALVPSGHIVAYNRLKAGYDEADWASERMEGPEYLLFLQKLVEKIDNDWDSVRQSLDTIRTTLVNRSTMLVNVTLDQSNWGKFRPQLAAFLSSLPAGTNTLEKWNFTVNSTNEGLTIPAQVNYVGKGANLYDLGYKLHGSESVITNFLGTTYLWDKIRVQGGAYGGFCVFNYLTGVFSYISYRDPNLLRTLTNYDGVVDFLRNVDLSTEEIHKSIIGAIGEMDAYKLPDAKGYSSMIRHLTAQSDEFLQQRRDELLGTSTANFREFADALAALNTLGRVVVVGSQNDIEAANAERSNFLKVTKLL
jgi:presequence protease